MAKNFITNLVIGGKLNPSLQAAFSKAGKIASKNVSRIGKVGAVTGKALAGIGTAALGAAGIAGAATVKMMGGFLENADSLEKMRTQTGLTYNQLQKLQYIGGQLSVSMSSITKATGIMNKNMLAATKGGSDMDSVFKALGVSVTDSTGKLRPQSDVFNETLAALSSISNVADRNALAFKVFGRGAQDMFPLLDAGTNEIKRMSGEAEKLGLVLSDEAIKAGDNFGDTLAKLKGVAGAVGGKLMAGLVPALQKLADTVLANMPLITSIVSDVFGTLGDTFVSILPSLLPVVQQLMPVIASTLKALLPIIGAISNFISGLIPMISPIIEMLTPFISQLVQKLLPIFLGFLQQMAPIFLGLLQQIMPFLMQIAQQILPMISVLMQTVFAVLQPFLPTISYLIDTLLPPLMQILQAIMPVLQVLTPIVIAIANAIGTVLGGAIRFVMPLIEKILKFIEPLIQGVGKVIGSIGKFFGIGGDDKSTPAPMPGYAGGGIATRPSIFGEAGPEMAIPLQRTPRSLGLLNKTAQMLGANNGSTQIIYAPQIYGASRAEIEPALRSSFEQFKAWYEQMQIENGRVAF